MAPPPPSLAAPLQLLLRLVLASGLIPTRRRALLALKPRARSRPSRPPRPSVAHPLLLPPVVIFKLVAQPPPGSTPRLPSGTSSASPTSRPIAGSSRQVRLLLASSGHLQRHLAPWRPPCSVELCPAAPLHGPPAPPREALPDAMASPSATFA